MAKGKAYSGTFIPRKVSANVDWFKANQNRMQRAAIDEALHQAGDWAADNWYRCLACAGLAYMEDTGSQSKTQKYLNRLSEFMMRNLDKPTAELMEMLDRQADVQLEVQG